MIGLRGATRVSVRVRMSAGVRVSVSVEMGNYNILEISPSVDFLALFTPCVPILNLHSVQHNTTTPQRIAHA